MHMLRSWVLLTIAMTGCGDNSEEKPVDESCPDGDPTIHVPEGFCATIFADGLFRPRQLTVSSAGDVFVALGNSRDGLVKGHVVALRDADGDGTADDRAEFGDAGGTGVLWRDDTLYFAEDDRVIRWSAPAGTLTPTESPAVVVGGLPKTGDHAAKAIQMLGDGRLLVVVGSETNACQPTNRTPGTPGIDPCPELAVRAGVWSFDPTRTDQTQADGSLFATGVRNATSFAVHPTSGLVVTANNGRDQLHEFWPTLFSAEDDKVYPSEELAVLTPGTDRGWPYCYHDPIVDQMKLAPEYGGDRVAQGRCAAIPSPMLALPAHWASLGMTFYTGDQFPEAYRGGAFLSFHGSRFDPLADDEVPGYSVGFISFDGDTARSWDQFATGFAGDDRPLPDGADHRPVGVATSPAGDLYITDDQGGRVWRIRYQGLKAGD